MKMQAWVAWRLILWSSLILVFAVQGCTDDTTGLDDGEAVFLVEVSDEEFRVKVTTEDQLADLEARRRSGAEGIVMGELVAGSGGFNTGWSWHLDPESVAVVDMSIELCDGRPSFVEDDLDYWLETVGAFCPWGARVVRRLR